MPDDPGSVYLQDVIQRFQAVKKLGDGAMSQIADPMLSRSLDPESNSIAVLVQHLAGNMRSRWTDFMTTDGEKPSRDRDAEFELSAPVDRGQVLAWWEEGWGRVFQALGELRAEDLTRSVTIRQVPHSVVQAINLQLAHYAYHTGQIVLLARHFTGAAWRTLSIPRRKPQ